MHCCAIILLFIKDHFTTTTSCRTTTGDLEGKMDEGQTVRIFARDWTGFTKLDEGQTICTRITVLMWWYYQPYISTSNN